MNKLQIAVDYLIVFVFVLFIFVLVFSSLANQRVLVSNQQVFAQLQYVSQLVASQLSSAYQAGNGYNATVQLPSPLSSIGYNITITRQGMVVVTTNVIGQQIQATSFSLAQSIVSNSNYLNPSKLYYTIPTEQSTGFITFQNSFGTICVDYMCPSTSQQSKSLVVYDQVASALNLNGQNVFASSTSPSTSSSTQSVSFWMRPSTPASVGYLIDQGVGGSPNNFVYLSGGNLYAGVSSAACHSELSLSPNVWYFVTYAVGSSTLNLYVNGSLGSGCTASVSPAAPLSVNLGQEAGGSNRFSGELANVQLYSTQLSQLQAQQLYQEGISGQPLQGAGLSGWWPLSSDGTDHSGKGNNLQVSGTAQYQNVVQVFGKVQNFTGVLLQFVPVGFESSLGSFESQQAAQSYTNNGIAYQFLNPGQAGGNANVKVVAFNGNLSTTSNLVAWWPLAEGQGSVAYDLGPSSESASPLNGKLIDSWWSSPNYVMQFSNANILMAKSIVPGSGLSQFTESAWIYFNTIPAQAEIAGEGSSNCGAASIYCFGYYGGSLKLGLAGCGTASTGTSFTPALHTWYFVAGSISGSGTGTIYVNGKQYASLNPVDACVNSAPFQIGSDGNTDFFPGKIANVQLYSTLLNAQQIQAMYNEGIGGAPIITTGLVGWWPLNGDTLDYSGSGNNGIAYGSIQLVATNQSQTQGTKILSGNFIATSSVAIGSNAPITPSGAVTVTAWVKALPTSVIMPAIGTGEINSGIPAYELLLTAAGAPQFTSRTAGSSCAATISAVNFEDGQWHFIAGTYNGMLSSVYADGNLQSNLCYSSPTSMYYGSTEPQGYIGSWNGAHLRGLISNVQIYSSALGVSQLTQLYKEGITGFPLTGYGLSGWWPLNGDANDYSAYADEGTPNALTYNSQSSFQPIVSPSLNGSGISLNAQGGYAQAPALQQGFSQMSLAAWVYPNAKLSPKSVNDIISEGASRTSGSWELAYVYPSNAYLSLYAGSGWESTNSIVRIPSKAWSSVIATYDGAGNVIFYVDGVQDGPYLLPSSGSIAPSSSPTCIGNSFCTGSNLFNGTISDVQVYNTALTQQQAFQLYNAGPPPTGTLSVSLGVTP